MQSGGGREDWDWEMLLYSISCLLFTKFSRAQSSNPRDREFHLKAKDCVCMNQKATQVSIVIQKKRESSGGYISGLTLYIQHCNEH